jgi:transposase-like protein
VFILLDSNRSGIKRGALQGPGLRRRPLQTLYPLIYLDAVVVKVRDGAHARNKAAHITVGVDIEGVKHVLGIWIQTIEGARL